MRIKEVVKRTGLTEKTIRYYESKALVTPDMLEKNGRQWRDYTEDHIRALSAVATLRKARFHVEEIARMQADPGCIPSLLPGLKKRVDEAYETLGRLKASLDSGGMADSPDVFALAERLSAPVEPLALPEIDVKFNFRRLDKLAAEERRHAEAAPSRRRLGWLALYDGNDEARFQEVRDRLGAMGVPCRTRVVDVAQRLTYQGMMNVLTPQVTRVFGVSNYGLQAKLLGDEKMNHYTVEIRKRDEERARRALRVTA